MGIYADVTKAVGDTPLIRLNRLTEGLREVLVKLESANPMSSVKDRIRGRDDRCGRKNRQTPFGRDDR